LTEHGRRRDLRPGSNDMPAYDPNNPFAKILRGEWPSHRVYEDEKTIVIMDIMPRAPGHVLVIPKAPSRNIFDVAPEDLGAVAAVTRKVARAVVAALGADGVTIQQFNESAGGQVVFHLHVHVIPRHEGVAMKPHTGERAPDTELADLAAKIRTALDAA
jgi:histidine triad (HIT) family protein